MTDRLRELADRPTDRTAIEWLSDRIDATLSRGSRIFVLQGAELDWVRDAIRKNSKMIAHGECGAKEGK